MPPEGSSMQVAPKVAGSVTAMDWIGAPLTGGLTAGAGYVSAHLLNAWGVLPPLAASVVDSAAFAAMTGVVASLPVVLGFWLKFRRQTVDNRALEDRLNQAERQAITAERTALINELRADLDARRTELIARRAEIVTLQSLVDARDLSLHERDATIAARDATIAALNQQVHLLTGLVGQRGGGPPGG